jgi:hypothetical protein
MSGQASGADSEPAEGVPAVPAYVERRENCPRYVFAGGVWIGFAGGQGADVGNIANIESIYQNGGGLPRLVHEREAEMAYVISGACEFGSQTRLRRRPNPARWSSSRAGLPAGLPQTPTIRACTTVLCRPGSSSCSPIMVTGPSE